jgi:transcriptional regulator with XRE-family HTH domain|tara:strand:- start:384 stop:971 length:588 start_codon:yes stop_codon:yes gene_type:complete
MSEKEYIHSVGVYISDVRKSKGLTQTECGKAADISRSTISDIEKGLRLPSGKDVLSLCQVLDLTPNDIFSCGNSDHPFTESRTADEETVESLAMMARAIYSFYKLSRQSKRLMGDTMFRLAEAENGHDFVNTASFIKDFVSEMLSSQEMKDTALKVANAQREGRGKPRLEGASFEVVINELVEALANGDITKAVR